MLALVSDQVHQPEKLWDLVGLQARTCCRSCETAACDRGFGRDTCHFGVVEMPMVRPAAAGAQVVCGTMGLPTATVRMRGPDGIARTSMGMGTGPVDAAYKAIDALVRVQVLLLAAHACAARLCTPLHCISVGAQLVGSMPTPHRWSCASTQW